MSLSHRIRRQDGLTLGEVLVVLLLLGLLAALSYPIFSGQDKSALDAEAKSNARSLLWKVHTCFTSTEDYTLCDEPSEQEPPPGVTWGSAPGEVEVVRGPETTRYKVTVRALSRASSGGQHHTYTLVKQAGGEEERSCESGSNQDDGGCEGGDW